jgi:sulfur carrier protein
MRLIVNGEERHVAAGATVAQLLGELQAPPAGRGVAVAVDAEVVPRSDWEQCVLREGSRVEVLIAVQGG